MAAHVRSYLQQPIPVPILQASGAVTRIWMRLDSIHLARYKALTMHRKRSWGQTVPTAMWQYCSLDSHKLHFFLKSDSACRDSLTTIDLQSPWLLIYIRSAWAAEGGEGASNCVKHLLSNSFITMTMIWQAAYLVEAMPVHNAIALMCVWLRTQPYVHGLTATLRNSTKCSRHTTGRGRSFTAFGGSCAPGYMYKQTKQTNKQTNSQTEGITNRTNRQQTDRQANKQTKKQTDRQTNRQTNKQTDKQTNKQTLSLSLSMPKCFLSCSTQSGSFPPVFSRVCGGHRWSMSSSSVT